MADPSGRSGETVQGEDDDMSHEKGLRRVERTASPSERLLEKQKQTLKVKSRVRSMHQGCRIGRPARRHTAVRSLGPMTFQRSFIM